MCKNEYFKDAADGIKNLTHKPVEFEDEDYFVPVIEGYEFLSVVKNTSPVFIDGKKNHDVICVVAEYKHKQ